MHGILAQTSRSMRITKNRQAILDELKKGGAYTAQVLHNRLPDMDLATIYRNLKLFTEEGVVSEINLKKDESMYELTHDHQHAICTNCGKVLHVTVDTDSLKDSLEIDGFEVQDIELTIKGHCLD